ncbi:MAG: hypothetical protein V1770_00265 [bacterium]
MKKNLFLFIAISAAVMTSLAYIYKPINNASAVTLSDMKEEGLRAIGTTAYGSEQPQRSVSEIIAEIIKYILSFLGIIFLILTLYGGFLWMTAGGNDEQVAKSKTIIINGVVGLIIILSAYAITFFVLENVIKATTGMSSN